MKIINNLDYTYIMYYYYLFNVWFFVDGVLPTNLPSPGSSIRDGAQRILQLCQKSEWPPLDQALKVVEKLVAAGGEDVTSTPLAGVVDQVLLLVLFYALLEYKVLIVPTMRKYIFYG